MADNGLASRAGRVLRSLAPWLSGLAVLLIGWFALGALGVLDRFGKPFAKQTFGRIYVESPEVYTRQRLVNDRLAQETWLNEQLVNLDKDTATFIDTWSQQRLAVELALIGQSSPETPAAAPGEAPRWAEQPETPFQAVFDLKSAARDKIRQLLLENALDDRHDLSGNTVYGLKFDTAVVPGSNTTLRPTVIVKMGLDPFPKVTGEDQQARNRKIESAVVLGSAGIIDEDYAEPLERLTEHFSNWSESIEVRLNDYIQGSCRTKSRAIVAAPEFVSERASAGADFFQEAQDAKKKIEECVKTFNIEGGGIPTEVLSAVGHVIGLTDHEVEAIGKKAVSSEGYRRALCRTTLDARQSDIVENVALDLPFPWASFFTLTADPDPWGLKVDPRTSSILITTKELDKIVANKRCEIADPDDKISVIDCNPNIVNKEKRAIYIHFIGNNPESPSNKLSDDSIVDLYNRLEESNFCMSPQFGPVPVSAWKNLPEGTGICVTFAGRRTGFNSGFYNFVNKVREIDTYAYAAFPRGDVSGVVSETDATVEGTAAVGSFLGRLRGSTAERKVLAEPRILNFAAGEDSGEMFDFGWTIVKEGRKGPMLASQLVLVSVPAYLDKIELAITEGWLDSDVVLEKGQTWEGTFPTLEDRIKLLIKEPETITTTVHLPPDYQALDSLVAPAASRLGPLINQDAMSCTQQVEEPRTEAVPAEGDAMQVKLGLDGEQGYQHQPPQKQASMTIVSGESPAIVIPGARLWRSTVVTLGGYRAKKIEVMPDMRGIIATFDAIILPIPRAVENAAGSLPDDTLDLIVWTSEGKDMIPDFAKILPAEPVKEALAPAETTEATQSPIEATAGTDASAEVSSGEGQ